MSLLLIHLLSDAKVVNYLAGCDRFHHPTWLDPTSRPSFTSRRVTVFGPVSYTHLDVYKRQVEGCAVGAGIPAERTAIEPLVEGLGCELGDDRLG